MLLAQAPKREVEDEAYHSRARGRGGIGTGIIWRRKKKETDRDFGAGRRARSPLFSEGRRDCTSLYPSEDTRKKKKKNPFHRQKEKKKGGKGFNIVSKATSLSPSWSR